MLVRNCTDVDVIVPYAGLQKRVVIGPKQGAPTFVMRIFDLRPGVSTPYHSHDWEHEVFVVSGSGVVTDEKGETSLEATDAVLVAPLEMHSFKNTGQATFRFMCLVPLRGEDTP